MKNLRLILIGWMLLWLIGNGVLAAAMSYCDHGDSHHGEHVVDTHHDHGLERQARNHQVHLYNDYQQGHGEASKDDQPYSLLGALCNNCDLCHLATSILPSHRLSNMLVLLDVSYQISPIDRLVSRSPDTPLRVPLS